MILMANAMMGAAGYQASGGSFRYLKVDILSLYEDPNGYMRLAEIELRDDEGTQILAQSISSPQTVLSGYDVGNAINGSYSDRYDRWIVSEGQLPIQATIDYGASVAGHSVVFRQVTDPGNMWADGPPHNIIISVSDDAANWDEVFSGYTDGANLKYPPYYSEVLIA